jgi:hypothetical protein
LIRWYDYVVAVFVAYCMIPPLSLALIAPTIWLQIFGSVSLVFLYDLWVNGYCKFRLYVEMKDGK